MHGQLQSSDEDGGHTIRSAIVENTMLRANFMAIYFTEPELLSTKGKVFRIGTVRYNWPMSVHESQAFIIAHWVTLTFAQRFRLVFSLSGFANLSTKITTKREFRLSFAERKHLAIPLSENTKRKLLAKVISGS